MGGGVAIYVQKSFQCKIIDTLAVDEIMESLTIEIKTKRCKSIVLSCIYRTPDSCMEQYLNIITNIFEKICDKKCYFVCGDFNIDLMKWNVHKATNDFCNTMFNFGLRPLICKPSRITKDSATPIDNIFTNVYGSATSGIFLNDITDHLPIFGILHSLIDNTSVAKDESPHKLMRIRTLEGIEALKVDLADSVWDDVYVEDVNLAYDTFLSIFLYLYNKHCPIRKCQGEKIVTENHG
uniref:Helentron 4 helitron-like transposon replicase/helicase/endonuclease n=2 Tax=Nothobranchius TaxID=28779 RepID=A0A1A8UYZ8_NOTFU